MATDSQAKASFQAQADSAGKAPGGMASGLTVDFLGEGRLLAGAYAFGKSGEAEALSRRWRVRSGSLREWFPAAASAESGAAVYHT